MILSFTHYGINVFYNPKNNIKRKVNLGKHQPKNAMVVVAHADDAEYGCSGTVAMLTNFGIEVTYVLCTDGSKGSNDPNMTSEKLIELRKQEQLDAAKVLGLKDVVFLNYPDSLLEPSLNLRHNIAQEIRRYKPNIVITSYPSRNLSTHHGIGGHPDHIAAGEATLSAVFPAARDRLTYPDMIIKGLLPHNVAETWIMGAPDTNLWIDVTPYINISFEALSQHKSQVQSFTKEDGLKRMKDWRQHTAAKTSFTYAESFKRIVIEESLEIPGDYLYNSSG